MPTGSAQVPPPAGPEVPAPVNLGQIPQESGPRTYGARAQVTPTSAPPAGYQAAPASAPPFGTQPASAPPFGTPPAFGTQPASAPPFGTQPASAPPYGNQGSAPSSAPPFQHQPFSGPPAGGAPVSGAGTGLYQASAPPAAGGTYQTSAPPPYGDLVSMPGEAPVGNPSIDGEPIPTPEPPVKSKRGLVVGLLIVAAVFLVAVAGTALVVKISNAGGTSFAVNSCVKQDGDSATGIDCSSKDAFKIVSKVDKPESCSDASQPYIVLQHKGEKDVVLCLRPASEK